MGINVLSLFDGMSCGRIALERAGIEVDNYFASEVDKYAIEIATNNYLDTEELGDVTGVEAWALPKIDLLIGGSPCQGFSAAGKQLNFDDPRSKLFFEFVRLLEECKPEFFLLENVKMKKEYQNIISKYLGVEPIEINSALVSAQNRKRLYWANFDISQPEDKGILLKDVLEEGNNRVYHPNVLKQNVLIPLDSHSSKVGLKCVAGLSKNKKWLDDGKNLQRNFSQGERVYSPEGKSPTLSANSGGSTGPGNALIYTPHERENRKGACIEIGHAHLNGHDFLKRVYSPAGKAPTLTAVCGGNQERKVATDEKHWRKLTPVECERLQTLPDNYTEGVSNSQRYRMLGNGWTVDVIKHIFECMYLLA